LFFKTMSPSVSEKLLILFARRFPIRRGKLRLVNLLWRIAAGGKTTCRLAELKLGRFKMPCNLQEILQRQFYFFGTYFLEEEILACWANEARHATVVLDVGANAGVFSLAALAVQPQATVHAFEPTPEIADRLRETAVLNGLDHLHVHEAAISDRHGEATLKRCRGELGTNEGMNFISVDPGDSGGERVPTLCLDQFCREHAIDQVDLLKLDIQGHEHCALAGAKQLIGSGRIKMIFVELNWVGDRGGACPASESIRMLDQAGYQFSKPGVRLHWQKAGNWLRTLSNVAACRQST